MTNEEMITIPKKKYDDMVERLEFLGCLEAAGVDNWEGFDYAYQMMEEKENK